MKKRWKQGSETEVILKKIAVVCLFILFIYRMGYACGSLLARLGF